MADFKFEIGEAQIQNAIAVAMAESFSQERKDQIIRDVVRAHLSRVEDRYDKETILEKSVGSLIRRIATEVLEEEIEKRRPVFYKVIQEILGPGFEENICTQLKNGLIARKVKDIHVSLQLEEDDD